MASGGKRARRRWPLVAAMLLVLSGTLLVAEAGATGDTVITFDDIPTAGVTVTNQYAPEGVTFGSEASFGISVPTNGCGAPVSELTPDDVTGGEDSVEPPRCGNSEFEYSGTVAGFSWPHETVKLFARALNNPTRTVRLTGYDTSLNQVAQTTAVVDNTGWTQITLSTGFLDSISYLVVDETTPTGSPGFLIDNVEFDANAAPLSVSGVGLSATAGTMFSGTVGHINDADTTAVPSDFSAQISWGDGSSSAGTVTAAAGGGFAVSGSHTYAAAGTLTMSVQVHKVNQLSPVSANGMADVAPVGATPGTLEACYHPPAGSTPLYMIGLPGAPSACDPGDVKVQWSANGRAGLQGPVGPRGPSARGPAGLPGRQGGIGRRGPRGPQGSIHPRFTYVKVVGDTIRQDEIAAIHATCPPNEVIASGGFQTFNEDGNLFVERSGPLHYFENGGSPLQSSAGVTDPLRTWGVTAVRQLGGKAPWHIVVYVLCWHR